VIWKFKKARGIKLNMPLKETIYLPLKLKPVAEELIDLHHLEHLVFYEKEPPLDAIKLEEGVYIKSSS
jgi:hypothetical protein